MMQHYSTVEETAETLGEHHAGILPALLSVTKPPLDDGLLFEAQPIVYRLAEVLLGPEIPFGGLDGSVAEQELDLLQLATGAAAEFRAGPAEIVRPQFSGI